MAAADLVEKVVTCRGIGVEVLIMSPEPGDVRPAVRRKDVLGKM